MGNEYKDYEDALQKIGIDSLKERREALCLNFAKKCLESENERCNKIFKNREKIHKMKIRNQEYFAVNHAKTERLRKSTIPYLQRLLNSDENIKGSKRKIKNLENEKRMKRRLG